MKVSQIGLNLIKSFESCRLKAYKAVSTEKYYTIGWGHYGADVNKDMKITQAQADAYLASDISKFEAKVNKYQSKYNFNQNQYDALVSFAYNVGSIDGLTANGTRTIAQISAKFSAYNKSGGKVLSGLVKRRASEKKLFDTPVQNVVSNAAVYYPKYTGNSISVVVALAAVGEKDTSLVHRKLIAGSNGIKNYKGSIEQNLALVNLLKKGICKRA